jgi:hypothetical protein
MCPGMLPPSGISASSSQTRRAWPCALSASMSGANLRASSLSTDRCDRNRSRLSGASACVVAIVIVHPVKSGAGRVRRHGFEPWLRIAVSPLIASPLFHWRGPRAHRARGGAGVDQEPSRRGRGLFCRTARVVRPFDSLTLSAMSAVHAIYSKKRSDRAQSNGSRSLVRTRH